MPDSIYHQKSAPLNINHSKHASASVALFHSGSVIVTTCSDYGSVSFNVHMDADSLRAFAKLLNDAVDALPAKVEDAADEVSAWRWLEGQTVSI